MKVNGHTANMRVLYFDRKPFLKDFFCRNFVREAKAFCDIDCSSDTNDIDKYDVVIVRDDDAGFALDMPDARHRFILSNSHSYRQDDEVVPFVGDIDLLKVPIKKVGRLAKIYDVIMTLTDESLYDIYKTALDELLARNVTATLMVDARFCPLPKPKHVLYCRNWKYMRSMIRCSTVWYQPYVGHEVLDDSLVYTAIVGNSYIMSDKRNGNCRFLKKNHICKSLQDAAKKSKELLEDRAQFDNEVRMQFAVGHSNLMTKQRRAVKEICKRLEESIGS